MKGFFFYSQILIFVVLTVYSCLGNPCPIKKCLCYPADPEPSLRVLYCRGIPQISHVPQALSTNELFYEINFQNSNVTEIFDGDLFGLRTKRLEYGDNQIRRIHPRAFSGFKFDLEYISLSGDGTNTVPFYALQGLVSLKALILKKYTLLYLDESAIPFHNFPNLQYLSLSNMGVIFFSSHTFENHAYKLTEFRFSNNPEVSTFPVGSMKHLRNIKKLTWSGNVLDVFPSLAIRDLVHLEMFDISANNIRILEDGCFSGVTEHLQELNLSRNRLMTISILREFTRTRWKELTSLDLSFNQVAILDHSLFEKMKALKHLDLSSNKLATIGGKALKHLTNLQSIDLSANKLLVLNVCTLTFSKVLEKLDLQHQDTGSQSMEFKEVHGLNKNLNIKKIYLSNTKLSDSNFWQFLQHLPYLSELYADSSGLSMIIPGEFANTNLTFISLRHNHIHKLFVGTFTGLENTLETLNLGGNRLNEFDECVFKDLKALRHLDFSQNHLDCTCNLQWFIDWQNDIFSQEPDFDYIFHLFDLKCNTPSKFQDIYVQIALENLTCNIETPKNCNNFLSTTEDFKHNQANMSWVSVVVFITSVILPSFVLCFVSYLLFSMIRTVYRESTCCHPCAQLV